MFQVLYKGENVLVKDEYIFSKVIQILAEDDFDRVVVERVGDIIVREEQQE